MRLVLFFLCTSYSFAEIAWKTALKQKSEWYAGDEARELANQVILFQRSNGGWPKNQDMAEKLSKKDRNNLQKLRDVVKDTTIDNGATYTPLKFLIRVWKEDPDANLEAAIHRGLSFLMKSQYPGGGWPQRPYGSGYGLHITYNDNAMIGVMSFLRDLKKESPAFLTDRQKSDINSALARGLECILKTQIKVDGKPAVWCAQHDARTLLPAKARSYELPSFSGAESAGIVRYLMEIKDPPPRVRQSINGAIVWFRAHRIRGIRIEKKDGDKVVIKDENAPALWARFYDLKTGKPIFSGRDGVIKSSLKEIEAERRNGYAWYVTSPRSVLKDYKLKH